MTQPEFTHRRYVQAEEIICEQREELRLARNFIWLLVVMLTLTAGALGFLLTQTNFRNAVTQDQSPRNEHPQ